MAPRPSDDSDSLRDAAPQNTPPEVTVPLDDATTPPHEHSRAVKVFMNAAHRADVIGALRRARHQLPGDPAFGDPLSVTGPGGPRAVARAADKIVGGQPSAAREIGFGALQIWQAALEKLGRGQGEREVTIMFTDLVAFSSWSLSAGDEATLELLRRVSQAVEPVITEQHHGRVVKRMGDGLMAVFDSADAALAAAREVKRQVRTINYVGYQPRMRIGLHTGSPREIGGDWLGVDVNIAARVMEAGANGRTMASATTLEALTPGLLDELGYTSKPYRRGWFTTGLNGVPEDLRIYRLNSSE